MLNRFRAQRKQIYIQATYMNGGHVFKFLIHWIEFVVRSSIKLLQFNGERKVRWKEMNSVCECSSTERKKGKVTKLNSRDEVRRKQRKVIEEESLTKTRNTVSVFFFPS